MNSTGLLQLFRLDMDDLESPYLWSDMEIFSYMTDAQEQLCRKTEGIADATTPDICRIDISTEIGQWYPKSDRILKVRGAVRADTGRAISVVNPEHMGELGMRLTGQPGNLSALVDGLTDGMFMAYPSPSVNNIVWLSVFRLPLYEITDVDQPLEVAAHHHRALLLWMRHLAYDKQDADTYNAKLSAEYEARFDKYCYKALAEQERARRVVGVTVYGGIGGGVRGTSEDYGNRWRY